VPDMPTEFKPDLSARLERILQEDAEILARQGSLVLKCRRQRGYWYLRYFVTESGKRRQKSVYIGRAEDSARLQLVRERLEQLRSTRDCRTQLHEIWGTMRKLNRQVLPRLRRPHAPCGAKEA